MTKYYYFIKLYTHMDEKTFFLYNYTNQAFIVFEDIIIYLQTINYSSGTLSYQIIEKEITF